MYYLITSVWIVVTIVSWVQGNRKVPIAIAGLGVLTQLAIWTIGIGFWGIAILAVLTLVGMFSVPEIFMSGKR